MGAIDWFNVFELLLRGPSGWLALGLGSAATTAFGYFAARHRYQSVRKTTHAFMGVGKGFETQNERDVENMFFPFKAWDKKSEEMIADYRRAKGGTKEDIAADIDKVAQQMLEECEQLLRTNIAFRTKAGHLDFMDRIDNHRATGQWLRSEVRRLQRKQPMAKSA